MAGEITKSHSHRARAGVGPQITGTFVGLLMIEHGEVGTEPLVLSISGCISPVRDPSRCRTGSEPPGTLRDDGATASDARCVVVRGASSGRAPGGDGDLGAVGSEDGEGVAVELRGPAGEVHDVVMVVAERARLTRSVVPPSVQWMTWWARVQPWGRVHPGIGSRGRGRERPPELGWDRSRDLPTRRGGRRGR